MASFWSKEDGTAIEPEKEFSAGGGDFDVIPKGTSVLVAVEDAAWKTGYEITQEFVNLKCRVLKPEGYANRVLFFKLWADELDPGQKDQAKAKIKREKHQRMLLAIDANAKGKLAKLTARPTDPQLGTALIGAQFVANLGVWEQGEKKGNWLQAAKPKASEISAGPAPKRAAAPMFEDDDLGDDVPFN